MAQPQSELNDLLLTLTANVYFQPPSNLQMELPYIRYERSRRTTEYAADRPYFHQKGYTVTVVDRDPNSPIAEALADLPRCGFDRHYRADDLNHDVYTIFF